MSPEPVQISEIAHVTKVERSEDHPGWEVTVSNVGTEATFTAWTSHDGIPPRVGDKVMISMVVLDEVSAAELTERVFGS